MKTFIKKNWALIGWVFSIVIDQQFQIVEMLFHNPELVKLTYGIGSIILAKFWNTNKNIDSSAAYNKGAVTPDKGF